MARGASLGDVATGSAGTAPASAATIRDKVSCHGTGRRSTSVDDCRGRFDDAAVLSDGGVYEQRLRLLMGEEVVEGRVEETGVEMELLLVFGAQRRVGVDDAHQFCVVLLRELWQKADDMAVLEADDGDANGSGLSKNLRRDKSGDDGDSEECSSQLRYRHAFMLPLRGTHGASRCHAGFEGVSLGIRSIH